MPSACFTYATWRSGLGFSVLGLVSRFQGPFKGLSGMFRVEGQRNEVSRLTMGLAGVIL